VGTKDLVMLDKVRVADEGAGPTVTTPESALTSSSSLRVTKFANQEEGRAKLADWRGGSNLVFRKTRVHWPVGELTTSPPPPPPFNFCPVQFYRGSPGAGWSSTAVGL